ncbi:MAG: TlpA disulfide reductase family protein [Dehalococcoidia bacterium]|nr:TlpA disulfide reductase family protein [Dehalococcoidia bacterium]
MRRSEMSDNMFDVEETEVRESRSRSRLIIVVGLMLGIMAAAVLYVKSGDTVGAGGVVFSQLAEPPQIGRVVAADSQAKPMSQVARINEAAPNFTFVDATGVTQTLSDYKGQAVMINFWASWCPPCVGEMPDIEATYRENQSRGLVILGVNLDEDPNVARRFLQLRGITFPSVADTDQIAVYLYRVSPIPETFFIDREGILRDIQIGAMTKGMIKSRIDKIL